MRILAMVAALLASSAAPACARVLEATTIQPSWACPTAWAAEQVGKALELSVEAAKSEWVKLGCRQLLKGRTVRVLIPDDHVGSDALMITDSTGTVLWVHPDHAFGTLWVVCNLGWKNDGPACLRLRQPQRP